MPAVSYPLSSVDAVRFTHAWEDRQPIEHAGRPCVVLSRRVDSTASMTFELAYLTDDQLWKQRNFIEGPAQRAIDTVNELTELLGCEDDELIERVRQLVNSRSTLVQSIASPTREAVQVAQGEALDRFGLALSCPRAVRVFDDSDQDSLPGFHPTCEYDADYRNRLLSLLPPDFTQWTALADLTVESAQPLVGQWIEGTHRGGNSYTRPAFVHAVKPCHELGRSPVRIENSIGPMTVNSWLVRVVEAPTTDATFDLPDNANVNSQPSTDSDAAAFVGEQPSKTQ